MMLLIYIYTVCIDKLNAGCMNIQVQPMKLFVGCGKMFWCGSGSGEIFSCGMGSGRAVVNSYHFPNQNFDLVKNTFKLYIYVFNTFVYISEIDLLAAPETLSSVLIFVPRTKNNLICSVHALVSMLLLLKVNLVEVGSQR